VPDLVPEGSVDFFVGLPARSDGLIILQGVGVGEAVVHLQHAVHHLVDETGRDETRRDEAKLKQIRTGDRSGPAYPATKRQVRNRAETVKTVNDGLSASLHVVDPR